MTGRDSVNHLPCVLLRLIRHGFFRIGLVLLCLTFSSPTQADTVITETPGADNVGTQVSPPSGNVYGITGGKTVGNNLFHSFDQFNVATGDIAQFQTLDLTPNVSMGNILGRVTGVNPSAIFGTIDSATYYPNANFFLMNPNGILFGPSATLDIGGMAHFTTADYLLLREPGGNNAGIFHADLEGSNILTNAPITSFGFLGSNPAAIAIQGGQLMVANGTGISLVGGNHGFNYDNPDTPDTGATASVPDGVTMTGGRLSAPSGQINLVGVASTGAISAIDFLPAPGMTMGGITLSQGSFIDVSGDGGGTVRIRGGQFIMDNAHLFASSAVGTPEPSTVISLDVHGSIELTNTSSIFAGTQGEGHGGDVEVAGNNVGLRDGSFIETRSDAGGQAGNILVSAGGDILITGADAVDEPSRIQSNVFSNGAGGFITVNGTSVTVADRGVIGTRTFGGGAAGDINLNVTNLNVTGGGGVETLSLTNSASSGTIRISATDTVSLLGRFDEGTVSRIENQNTSGDTGSILIDTHHLNLSDHGRINSNTFQSSVVPTEAKVDIMVRENMTLTGTSRIDITSSVSDVGALNVTAKNLSLAELSLINTQTNGVGTSGLMNVTVDNLTVMSGSQLTSASTDGFGNGGPINVFATGTITLTGQATSEFGEVKSSGIFSSTNGYSQDPLLTGNAGHLNLTAHALNISNNARIDSRSTGYALGNAGDTNISASTVTIDGGTIANSTEFSGNAGNTLIRLNHLFVTDGGQLNSSSVMRTIPFFEGEEIPTPTGSAGSITIQGLASPAKTVTISGPDTGIFTTTEGTGIGGDINILVGQSVTLTNGSSISASSTGPGNAGNIDIDAGNRFTMTDSSVTTEATQSGGGAIKITTDPSGTVLLTNSTISASVLDGTGGGGSVNIDPLFVILVNSQILATSVHGPGGDIFITTNLLLTDATSVISADSPFGVNGTVTIQSPNAPISGQIHPLGKAPLLATSLLNQQCASVAGGQFSSFTVGGRNGVPTEPGSWLTSPLAMAGVEPRLKAEGGKAEGERPDRQMLSLRQIAPAGFLTQAFAVGRSAGCTT